MSQIFDALQRSEAERSGSDLAELSAAADVLEVAEQQVVQLAAGHGRSTAELTQPENDHRTSQTHFDQFSHFQRIRSQLSSQSRLVCVTEEESLAAEKFRFLGVRLRHLQQKRSLKRVLVTSSMPEEGKSTVAANLACTLARKHPQRILLLEGDLRRPSLAQQLGVGRLPGLSEYLEGQSGPAAYIYNLDDLGFWVLPAGGPQRNPLELLQSRRLQLVMDTVTEWFDWIVIDSPPMLPLADTSVWMRLADAVLLVTRPGKTAKRALQRTLEAVEQSKLLGGLLNGSREAMLGNYYQYYGAKASMPPATHPENS